MAFRLELLHNNFTKNGLHNFDQKTEGSSTCGSPVGPLVINNNVVINQGGAGIAVGAGCPWANDYEIYDNIVINAGRAVHYDGLDGRSSGPRSSSLSILDGGILGTVRVYNNIFHTWNDDDRNEDLKSCIGVNSIRKNDNVNIEISNNVCYTLKDKDFIGTSDRFLDDNFSGSGNVWYFPGGNPSNAIPPKWDRASRLADPAIRIAGPVIMAEPSAPGYIIEMLEKIYDKSPDFASGLSPMPPMPPKTVAVSELQ